MQLEHDSELVRYGCLALVAGDVVHLSVEVEADDVTVAGVLVDVSQWEVSGDLYNGEKKTYPYSSTIRY